jgi:hypothetical protein
MERLNSSLDNSLIHSSRRYCRARVSRLCLARGGQLEPGRRANARYCADCAPIVRGEQSRLGKRKLRQIPFYRKHQREYRKQHREKHTLYMRGWRERRRQAGLAPTRVAVSVDRFLFLEGGGIL